MQFSIRCFAPLACFVVSLMWTSAAFAQWEPPAETLSPIEIDSGWVTNDGKARSVIWSDTVQARDVHSLRLLFDEVTLGEAPEGGQETVVRITSARDGHQQTLNLEHLREWAFSTAYFNGDRVTVELIADPMAQPSLVRSTHVLATPMPVDEGRTICGSIDNRALSNDPRCGRSSNGCTVWLIDDANHCFLTAGHCAGFSVVEFNVPLSNPDGSWNHPGPEDQYAVDGSSLQFQNGGVGNDWAYFGCFSNSTTGLTPFEAQGQFFVVVNPPSVSGQDMRITGYGTTSSPVPGSWNQVQKTHVGPYVTFSGTNIRYATDTTGGNSGSPVINEDTGQAIGIHTHGGCSAGGGANNGTGYNHAGLQNALANPQGVCIPIPPTADNNSCDEFVTVTPGTWEFDSTNATTTGPAEPGLCGTGDDLVRNDIWYRFIATCDGSMTLRVCDADFNTMAAVYFILCPETPGNAIACAATGCGDGNAEMTFDVEEGFQYIIRIGSPANEEGSGFFELICNTIECVEDIAGDDGEINTSDLLMLLSQWGECDECPSDLNGDGAVTITDLLQLLGAWGACP